MRKRETPQHSIVQCALLTVFLLQQKKNRKLKWKDELDAYVYITEHFTQVNNKHGLISFALKKEKGKSERWKWNTANPTAKKINETNRKKNIIRCHQPNGMNVG